MKIRFSKSVEYIPQWRGNANLPAEEQIKVTIKTLNMAHLLELMDDLQKATDGISDPDQLTVLEAKQVGNVTKMKELLKNSGHLLPVYATIHNLKSEDGTELTIEDIVNYPMFMGLAAEILSQLAARSMPNEEERKN